MKKLFITAAILLATLSGCQNGTETGLFGNSDRRKLETTVIGRLKQDATKTDLADDGRLIYWSKGDSIGLFNNTKQNVGARLEDASAGSTEGVFKAMVAGKAMYAYYPYSSGAKSTGTSVELNLPSTQVQHGAKPDMRYDLKVGSYVSGTASDGLVMEFTEKLSLLEFDLTPLEAIVGEKMESISLTKAGKALAGNFTLTLNDVTAPLAFQEEHSETVTLTFDEKPVLAAGQTVRGWMFVNPSVEANEHITIAVRTEKHIVEVDVNTAVGFSQGYKYRMPVDLPVLKSNGYVSIIDRADDFDVTSLNEPGIYDIDGGAYKVKYEEGVNQYASYTASDKYNFRIQSLPQGWAVSIQLPSALNADTVYDLTVSKTGSAEVADGTFKAKVISTDGGLCRLLDETNGTAYVIIK